MIVPKIAQPHTVSYKNIISDIYAFCFCISNAKVIAEKLPVLGFYYGYYSD